MRRWVIPLLLGLSIVCFALFHVVLPLAHGVDRGLQPNTVDAYYFLRYADIWPDYLQVDYFYNYPEGEASTNEVFPAIIAISARVFNISTTTAGAILPPLFFLLTLVAVYFLAYTVFKSKLIAALSVFLLSLMPGELLHRTMLGASDRHCLELFLFTAAMLFIMLAVANTQKLRLLITYSLLGTAFAVSYLLSWQGAPLIVLIMVMFLLALYYRKWQAWLAIEVITVVIFFVMPYLAVNAFGIFIPDITSTVSETMPLFFTAGQFDLATSIGYFGAAILLLLFGIGVLLHQYVKSKDKGLLLFLVWTVVMFALAFSMRRFAYYLAVNVAIMASFVSVYLVKLCLPNKAMVYRVVIALALTVPLLLGYRSTVIAQSGYGKMPIAWQECCAWLDSKHDMREGFINDMPIHYYTGEFSDYGVLSHWNYGYWIVREGHTPVSFTPGNWLGNDVLCKADISSDVVRNNWRYIVLDEEMFTTNAYPIFYSNGVEPGSTAVYKLFYFGQPIWQSSDGKVKVFEGY